jgi:hypothetical protein
MKFNQLTLKTQQPDWRTQMPVFTCLPPAIEKRHAAAKKLADQLKLGDLRTAEFEHGLVMAGERGDITVFHASGAVLARNAAASANQRDELRHWPGLAPMVAGQDIVFEADAAKRLGARMSDMLRPLELLGREAQAPVIQLDQVAQLDGKGKEIKRGAGQASVSFGYRVEGVRAQGAGAKTVAFAEPDALAGMLHAWRELGHATTVRLPALEEALGVGFLQDPELERHAAAGHAITVTHLELVYLALPAFMRQSHLFPALQIEGEVSKGKLGESFFFGRYHHAVSPKAYTEAGLYGSCLASNADGIVPLPDKAVRG